MTVRNSILVTRTKSEIDLEYLYRVEVKISSNSRAQSSLFRKNLNELLFQILVMVARLKVVAYSELRLLLSEIEVFSSLLGGE